MKPTDIITCKNDIKHFLTFKEFIKIDLRRRKKPVGTYKGLPVWIDNKVKPNTCYLVDKNKAIVSTNIKSYNKDWDILEEYYKALWKIPYPKGLTQIHEIC